MSREHREGIPRLVASFADRSVLLMAAFVLAAAYWVPVSRHNAWLYLVPGPLGAILPALYWTLRPFDPYDTPGAWFEGARPPGANPESTESRFTAAFRSTAARRTLWTVGGLLAALTLLISGVLLQWFHESPLGWTLRAGDQVAATLMFLAGSVVVQLHFLVRRILQEWPSSDL
jgi:hypothetical protein